MNILAQEDMNIGDMVDVSISPTGCWIRKSMLFPVGCVKRKIKKGDIVKYDPLGNTKDIATRKDKYAVI